jgi:hypothetical protein
MTPIWLPRRPKPWLLRRWHLVALILSVESKTMAWAGGNADPAGLQKGRLNPAAWVPPAKKFRPFAWKTKVRARRPMRRSLQTAADADDPVASPARTTPGELAIRLAERNNESRHLDSYEFRRGNGARGPAHDAWR